MDYLRLIRECNDNAHLIRNEVITCLRVITYSLVVVYIAAELGIIVVCDVVIVGDSLRSVCFSRLFSLFRY